MRGITALHEWALAEAIIGYVNNVLKEKNAGIVRKLVLRIGRLQSIDKEVLLFALNNLAKEYGVNIGEIVMHDEDVVLECRRCHARWTFSPTQLPEDIREAIHFVPEVVHSFTKCPRCGSRDFDIVSGRGLNIESIEVG